MLDHRDGADYVMLTVDMEETVEMPTTQDLCSLDLGWDNPLPEEMKEEQSRAVYNNKCKTVSEVEETVQKKECKQVEEQVCRNVPKMECQDVPEVVERQVPHEVCWDEAEKSCHDVPRKVCHQVPQEECEDVQDQVTREVCVDKEKEELAGKLGLEIDAETAKNEDVDDNLSGGTEVEVCEMIEDTTVVDGKYRVHHQDPELHP